MKSAKKIAVYGAYQIVGKDTPQRLAGSREAYLLVNSGKAEYRDKGRAIKMRLPEGIEVYRHDSHSTYPDRYVTPRQARSLVSDGAKPASNGASIVLTEAQGKPCERIAPKAKFPWDGIYRGASANPGKRGIEQSATNGWDAYCIRKPEDTSNASSWR